MAGRSNVASGPYEYDDDEDYVPTKKVRYTDEDEAILPVDKKHTLDSDEEEDDEAPKNKYDILTDEDIDGQEDGEAQCIDDIRITPFNMQEEMQEGHFDQAGYYQFKRGAHPMKDAWLDNVDWMKILPEKPKESSVPDSDTDSDSNSDDHNSQSQPRKQRPIEKRRLEVYEYIIPYLKEGESIATALKRLSGNPKRMSTAERWKKKKEGKLEPKESGPDMKDFIQLTEYTNRIIGMGNLDVYQETYEMINLKIQRSKMPKVRKQQNAPPVLDMFGDVDEAASTSNQVDTAEDPEAKDTFDEVQWQYRCENNDESMVLGPFSSKQMHMWQERKYFKNGVYVRKLSEQQGPWYNSNRVDFDIYL